MQLSIKTKIWTLGIVAVIAMSLGTAITYYGNAKLTADNKESNSANAIYKLNAKLHNASIQMLSSRYESLYELSHGAATEQTIAFTESKNTEMAETIDELIAAHPSFIAPPLLEDVKAEITELASSKLNTLIRQKSNLADIDEALIQLKNHYNKLKELLISLDKQLEERNNTLNTQINSGIIQLNNRLTIVFITSVIIMFSLIAFQTHDILRPLRQLNTAILNLAEGNLDSEIPNQESKDEIGNIARSTLVYKNNALHIRELTEAQKQKDQTNESEKRSRMEKLANSFETNVKSVVDMVASAATQMDATSRSVGQIVDNNKHKLSTLTGQIQSTSKNVQTVASAATQLSTAVNEINQQITRATAITAMAVEEAGKADITVHSLTEAAGKIGEVVEMINTIAAQINLLALNATIEAARAGDAGKGFAVVASEVKNLATQTTKATEQIAQFITSIQGATGHTVSAISNIGGKIREINEISTTIAAAVEQQSVATREIANNVKQASDSTQHVLHHAAEVSTASSETGESATQMIAATSELSRQSEMLRNEVDKFLRGVRA